MKFFKIIKQISDGKSLVRALLNVEAENYVLAGKVLDVGGGQNPSYLRFFKQPEKIELLNIDFLSSEKKLQIDLEKDPLPFDNDSFDQVLVMNLLEHIFNHDLLITEIYRATKSGGQVIGFVPFLIKVHPDPHDYFRYTKECLEKKFITRGFKGIEIKEIGGGPFYVNYNNISFIFPDVIRMIIFPVYFLLDKILLYIRPKIKKEFPLGYFFVLEK